MSTTPPQRSLSIDNINQNVRAAEYAVRGEIAVRSEEYRARLEKQKNGKVSDSERLPFNKVITANIGNPQQLDQKPITFFRQVLSILEYPGLLDGSEILTKSLGYKSDVIDRARQLLDQVRSVGAYSASQGAPAIRKHVAEFIEERDGFSADSEHIYLCAGASAGVHTMMNVICASPKTGVLIPIPQYPLYTATLRLLNARAVPYYLEEDQCWSTSIESIKEAYSKAIAAGTDVKAIVVINPGNPTGASLSADDIKSVIEFAAEKHLVLLADEVYQTNVFEGKFISFKKMLRTLQAEQPKKFEHVELCSMNSVSKGMVGECGHRAGYYELVGFDPAVVAEIYKLVSITLCPPVIGQCLVDLQVRPPKEGEPSYALYKKEYEGIEAGLKERAFALYEAFKTMEGVECQRPQGSMYLFPTLHLPQKAIAAAKAEGRSPDEVYCLRLLDATGICVVPGKGFGQKEGTLHLRTTFLAPGTEWVDSIRKFHAQYMDEFRET